MAGDDRLTGFVQTALAAGHDRTEIAARLRAAGWSASEIDHAMGQWAQDGFALPVPKPLPSLGARDAFLYALMFTALAVVLGFSVPLGFALIDSWLPDPADRIMRLAARMRWPIAVLIIFLPLFLILDRKMARATRRDGAQRRSRARAVLGFLALFLAAMTLLGDAISVVFTFLSGDLSLRFAAKSALVALLAALAFLYVKGLMASDPTKAENET
ncbi:DUF5671 domain-containing protein [Primorskyibacter flagellatus]|uniref:DUF5671 domain-containing protein n=1 Tax=Primorskyibacter flagellatus TaxID=1387277 RepID=UPI003A9558F2